MNQILQMMNAEEPNNNPKIPLETLKELAIQLGWEVVKALLKTPHGRAALAAIAAISLAGTMTYDWLQARKAMSGMQPA